MTTPTMPESPDNPFKGAGFERVAKQFFATQGISLSEDFCIDIGLAKKKAHCFDLGSKEKKILIECKRHIWTKGKNVPSAKMTVWNEAMYYFHLAPKEYRKYLFVLHDLRGGNGESLMAYYRRTYYYFIPDDVEFIEWDEKRGKIVAYAKGLGASLSQMPVPAMIGTEKTQSLSRRIAFASGCHFLKASTSRQKEIK